MFTVHCPSHGSRVLLGPRSITGFANTNDSIVVEWRCSCGATGSERFGPRNHAITSTSTTGSVLESAA